MWRAVSTAGTSCTRVRYEGRTSLSAGYVMFMMLGLWLHPSTLSASTPHAAKVATSLTKTQAQASSFQCLTTSPGGAGLVSRRCWRANNLSNHDCMCTFSCSVVHTAVVVNMTKDREISIFWKISRTFVRQLTNLFKI